MESQALKTVRVSLMKVVVKSYFPNENRVVLEIFFEDRKRRQMTRSTILGDANLLALQLMEELILKTKNDSADFDGEALKDVDVIIEDEKRTQLLLVDFFRTLHSKARHIRNSASSVGYLNLIKNLQMTELVLHDK